MAGLTEADEKVQKKTIGGNPHEAKPPEAPVPVDKTTFATITNALNQSHNNSETGKEKEPEKQVIF